jgi:outer membrane lipoprotein SlyB
MRRLAPPLALSLLPLLAACGPSYSPNTYATNAMQQASKVEQAVVVGVRPVHVSASGTVGAATGAAAGGVVGAAVPGTYVARALTGIGGALVGGAIGTSAEHLGGDAGAFEYIVRKPNGDLLSVTQRDKVPLALGDKVLVIAGTQARVVRDYTAPEVRGVAASPAAPSTGSVDNTAAPSASEVAAKAAEPASTASHPVDATPAPSGASPPLPASATSAPTSLAAHPGPE